MGFGYVHFFIIVPTRCLLNMGKQVSQTITSAYVSVRIKGYCGAGTQVWLHLSPFIFYFILLVREYGI